MFNSALDEAFALSVTTRKRMRSLPIEDPLVALERILDFVRTSTYEEAYRYLRSPPTANVPIRQKKDGLAGTGLIVSSLLLAPIWFVAAPMFIAGVAASVAPPPSDEAANRRNHIQLLEHLTALSTRVKAELSSDTSHARRLSKYLGDHGISGMDRVHSQTVAKDWDSFFSIRAGSAKRRRNGWHATDFGELHIGDLKAAFFGNMGDVIDLVKGSIDSVVVAQRCVVVVTYRGTKRRQLALFVPVGAFQTAAHIEAIKARVAAEAARERTRGASLQATARKVVDRARALAPGPFRRSLPSDKE